VLLPPESAQFGVVVVVDDCACDDNDDDDDNVVVEAVDDADDDLVLVDTLTRSIVDAKVMFSRQLWKRKKRSDLMMMQPQGVYDTHLESPLLPIVKRDEPMPSP
jgi:hypothetical protein